MREHFSLQIKRYICKQINLKQSQYSKLNDGSCLSAAAEWLEWEVRGSGGLNSGTGAEVKRVAGVETLLLALRPYTNYTVQALAYTAAGDGVPANPVHCTTQQNGIHGFYNAYI